MPLESDASSVGVVIGMVMLCVMFAAAIGLLWYRIESIRKKQDDQVAEIKSKIGALIREINDMNKLDIAIDTNQNNKLIQLLKS